jgi:hypothetical protein
MRHGDSVVEWIGEDPKVPAAGAAGRQSGGDGLQWRADGPAGLAYRFGQRGQVVHRGFRLNELAVVTHDVPTPWSGEP